MHHPLSPHASTLLVIRDHLLQSSAQITSSVDSILARAHTHGRRTTHSSTQPNLTTARTYSHAEYAVTYLIHLAHRHMRDHSEAALLQL